MHEGFEESNIATSVRFAIEIDSRYLDSSMRNNSHLFDSEDTVFINSDVSDVNCLNMPEVDGLIAGIPCTGASKSGRAKNKLQFAEDHETAGTCFFSTLNIIKYCNPAFGVIENVSSYQNTASFSVIKSVLGQLGYNLFFDNFIGSDFGASETRKRLVCIFVSKGLDQNRVTAKLSDAINAYKTTANPLKNVIQDVPLDSPRWKTVDYLKQKAVKDKESGKGFKLQLLTHDSVTCGTIGCGYAKQRTTEPRLVHPDNPELSRLFTPAEHAMIKGAPCSIIDGLSDTVAHEVLGNSVIYPLFKAVARAISDTLIADCVSFSANNLPLSRELKNILRLAA